MTTTRATPAPTIELGSLIDEWARSLRSERKSERTIRSYTDGARAFVAFSTERGMPTDVAAIRREHVEMYIVDVLDRWKPSTALTRYRDLQQLFRWLVDEGEIAHSPMEKMRPPKLDEKPVPVISDEHLKALLDACVGRAFDDRRDTAIIRLFMNTGARLSEIANLSLDDLDLDRGRITVRRKGDRVEVLPLGAKTAVAIDRYMRARRSHGAAGLPRLWLGSAGALTVSGIQQLVRRRCRQAGIPPINVHRFRHTWAHEMKSKGARDEEVMTIGGWRSATMLVRYGKSAATERAAEVHFRLAPGEDL
jgi:site-specific recombinase XerD